MRPDEREDVPAVASERRQDHPSSSASAPGRGTKTGSPGYVWFVPNPGFAAADIDLSEAIEEGRRICRVH